MKTAGVYQIYNRISKKSYVGSSVDIYGRWQIHIQGFKDGSHTGPKLLRSWKKYGPEVWDWNVLEEITNPNRANLEEREQFWIDKLDAFHNGYNSLAKAYSGAGRVQSQEEIRKRVETRRRRGNYCHTAASRKKISDVQRGKTRGPMSVEQKQLLSRIRRENPWSEQQIADIRNRRIGQKASQETVDRISESHKGYVMPAEQKRKSIRNQMMTRRAKGQFLSQESCDRWGIEFIERTE